MFTGFLAVTEMISITGDDYGDCCGMYYFSKEESSINPNFPVYKCMGKDRYIYKHTSDGWRVGAKEHLSGEKAGGHWFKGTFHTLSYVTSYIPTW